MTEKPKKTGVRRFALAVLLAVAFLAAIYVAVQLYAIWHHTYKTETAILYTMSDSVELNGVAVFDAQDVAGSGTLGYLVEDGERVTDGTVVAEYYTQDGQGLARERLTRLERIIAVLTKSQNSAGSDLEMLTAQTRTALYNLLDQLDSSTYAGLLDVEDEFLLAQNRMQVNTGQTDGFDGTIAALQTERDGLETQLAALQTVVAHTNGYFVSAAAAPDITVDPQMVAGAEPAQLQALLQSGFPKADTDRAGRIVTGFGWRFYAVCDLETAARFDGVSTVQISVPGKQETPLAATVESVTQDEEAGVAKVVLLCQSINAGVLSLGVETARIDLKTYEGLRIDRSALHIWGGEKGVFVKYGNLQRFRKITILYENENYILVPKDGALGSDSEVRLYDEIIVEGTDLQDGKLL